VEVSKCRSACEGGLTLMVATVDLALWMPLVVTGLTLFAGFLGYSRNKSIDRKHALIELRRAVYREFILSIAEVGNSQNGVLEVNNYKKKLAELHLVASDEVVRACAEYTGLYRLAYDPGPDARAQKYAELEMAMRRDCFQKTSITVSELREMLPFNF
jgi:hypothetical protein